MNSNSFKETKVDQYLAHFHAENRLLQGVVALASFAVAGVCIYTAVTEFNPMKVSGLENFAIWVALWLVGLILLGVGYVNIPKRK